jgi:GlpG protein
MPFFSGDGFVHLFNLLSFQPELSYRLISPILMHFSSVHLLMNSVWIFILREIEVEIKSWLYLVIVLIMAVVSNYGQFYFEGMNNFGGLSGVVYGLIGFAFINYKLFYFPPNLYLFSLIWFGLCWTGFMGNVANYGHTFGLVAGLVLGAIYKAYLLVNLKLNENARQI